MSFGQRLLAKRGKKSIARWSGPAKVTVAGQAVQINNFRKFHGLERLVNNREPVYTKEFAGVFVSPKDAEAYFMIKNYQRAPRGQLIPAELPFRH